MAMIKRGDGSTGQIVEAVDGDDKDMCVGCGHLFPAAELAEGKCGACVGDGGVLVQAQDAEEASGSCCCCEEKKAEG